MSLHRRRMFIHCVILSLIIAQPLIYIFYSSNTPCENKVQTLLLDNVTDKASIINLNTRILCWIPTTLKRLNRAIVVYE
jgi:hypothetical protein